MPTSQDAELREVQSSRIWCLFDSLLQPLIAGGQKCNCSKQQGYLTKTGDSLGAKDMGWQRWVPGVCEQDINIVCYTCQRQKLPKFQNKR